MPNQYCIICNQHLSKNDNLLLNNEMYHSSCYEKLLDSFENDSLNRMTLNRKREIINSKIQSANSMITIIKTLFGSKPVDIEKLQDEIKSIDSEIIFWEKRVQDNKRLLTRLYDYWPTYPPDWEERRLSKLKEADDCCEECGKKSSLHLHHIIRLGKGGSHKSTNLKVLCEKCHQKKHGNRTFQYRDNNISHESPENYFAKRLALINDAISRNLYIWFHYRKYDGAKSVRTIKPSEIEQKGKSQCVRGWCYLRNDKRVFAIKRMSKLRIEFSEPTTKASTKNRLNNKTTVKKAGPKPSKKISKSKKDTT